MAKSDNPSKLGALITLVAIVAVVAGLGFAAFHLTSAKTEDSSQAPSATTPQSSDLQNIQDQFDQL